MEDEEPRAMVSWLPFPGQAPPLSEPEKSGCRVRIHRVADGEPGQDKDDRVPCKRTERVEAGVEIVEDPGRRLVVLRLPAAPCHELRSLLYMCGFAFDLPENAWTRRLDKRGIAAADKVLRRISSMT